MIKKTSEKLKKLYKPFTVISIVSILTFAVNCALTYFWSFDSAIYELFEMIFGYIGIAFGFLGIMGILPAIISVLLIAISIAFAIKEKNYKNIANSRLWVTVILIIAGGFLYFHFLDGAAYY